MQSTNIPNRMLNILSLEDSQQDFEFLREKLTDLDLELRMDRVESEKEFEKALATQKYDIILADFNLPQYNAFEALKKAIEICPDIPFICVSGSIGEETAIELIKQGAVDYILKDKPDKLPYAIKRALLEVKEKQERIQIENNLIKSEERFRQVTESAGEWIWEVDASGVFTYASTLSFSLLGYHNDEIIGKKHFYDFFPPEVKESLKKAAFEAFARKEQFLCFENPNLHKDGHTVIIETNGFPILDDNGNLIGYRGADKDITQRKLAELELIKAKEKAEENDKLKTAFLHNISHEIRTPMNAILGFSNLLHDPNILPDKRNQYIDIITINSHQLLDIITNIINIATIEAGQKSVQNKMVNINSVLNLLYEQFITKTQELKIPFRYKTELSDFDAFIITDGSLLYEILSNLIKNALKFTNKGFVNYGYRVENGELIFYVEDTGIGIPSEKHDIIFEHFHQVEYSSTRIYGGSGLGLSISKAYVELLGGKIWVTSQEGKGSVFYFTLPYKKAIDQELATSEPTQKASLTLLQNKTILVVEDEFYNYMLLSEFFADKKINIVNASNGIDAIAICQSNPSIDLVIMDLKMPQMDGFEATRQIKEFRQNLPVIALSSYSSEKDIKRAMECGCHDFISKPVSKEVLLNKIVNHLLT